MILTGIGICVTALIGAGLYSARRVRGRATHFVLAGRTLSVPLVTVVLMSQAIDSNAILGNADLSAEFGFWAGASMPLGLALCLAFAGAFVAKRMHAFRVVTLPEYFAKRFDRSTEIIASILTVMSFCILLAGNLVALGFFLDYFLGVGYSVGIALTVPFVLAYTIAGGMFASAYTGVVQVAVMVVGVLALFVWVLIGPGLHVPDGLGPGDLGQLTDPAQGAAINWATVFALGFGNLVAIDLMQRIFSARSPRTAQRACFTAAAGILVLCVPVSLVALAAIDIVGADGANGPILYLLLGEYAPEWLAILVLSGILAASLTTVSGVLLSTATVLVRNVFRIGGANATMTARVMNATRLAMLPMAALGAVIALRVAQTGILLTLTFDLLLACLVAPFLLGLYWNRGDRRAVAAAVVTGIVVRGGFFVLTPTIYGVDNTLLYFPNELVSSRVDGWSTFFAAVLSFLAYIAVAAVTGPVGNRVREPRETPTDTVPAGVSRKHGSRVVAEWPARAVSQGCSSAGQDDR